MEIEGITIKDIDDIKLKDNIDLPPLSATVRKFTANSLEGDGVFDVLMHAVELHIRDEYDKNRITGSNYAQAYLGALQAVLPLAFQVTFEADKTQLELERLKVELATQRVQLEVAKAQLAQALVQIPLIKAQTLVQLAQVKDNIPNDEECYEGEVFNVHGVMGEQIRTSKEAVENSKKNSALSLFKTGVADTFSVIESAEGVGASYYGLNGSNAIEYVNNLRKVFGLNQVEVSEDTAGDHYNYINKFAPGKSVDTDE